MNRLQTSIRVNDGSSSIDYLPTPSPAVESIPLLLLRRLGYPSLSLIASFPSSKLNSNQLPRSWLQHVSIYCTIAVAKAARPDRSAVRTDHTAATSFVWIRLELQVLADALIGTEIGPTAVKTAASGPLSLKLSPSVCRQR